MTDPIELATFHLMAGEVDDALDVLTGRLDAAPDDDDARRLRAQTYTAQNTPDSLRAALKDTDLLAEWTPDDYLRLAVLNERLDDLPRAAGTLESAVRAYPDEMRLRQRWMEAAFKAGDLQMAHRAVQGVPDDWRMLEQAADLTAGYAAAASASELLPQSVALYDAALALMPSGGWSDPFRARILLARAGVYLRLNLPDEVGSDAEAAAALIPSEPACGFYAGWSLVKRGSTREGLRRVKTALKGASDTVREALLEIISGDEDFRDLAGAL
jgi:tetratricopeptide (TPR) repeat protein